MKKNRFNNFYLSYIGKSKSNILKVIIPMLIFVICIAIYITKISTALNAEKNNEDGIETVIIPKAKSNFEIKLFGNIQNVREIVLDNLNNSRY